MYAALGKNDQKIHVVPSKGWVVVRQGNAGSTTSAGNTVPIQFDNTMWSYLNQLVCVPSALNEVVENQIKIWPNPAADGWQIETFEAIERIEIFDLQGKMLRSVAGNNSNNFWLDAAGLPEGVLVVKVFAGGRASWGKVLKIKD
jgi:hypothetical protein